MSSVKFNVDALGKLTQNETGTITITYTTLGSDLTITDFTPKNYAGPLEIPRTLGGVTVTSIGYQAFYLCSYLTTVTFATGSQLTSIGDRSFREATRLTSITIPSTVTNIQGEAFNRSGLTTVTFDAGSQLESIGNATFSRCGNLRTLTFIGAPPPLKTIGNYAFELTGLTSIFIPDSVTYISTNAFLTSGLSKMYVSGTNSLGLTPGTQVGRFGQSVSVVDVTTIPSIAICFPAGTKVTTDQGDIAIEKLESNVHTIRGKKIVGITKTIPLQKHIISIEKDALAKNVPSVTTQISKEHKLFYKGKMVKARDLVEVCQGVTAIPYNGEILYNVLLKKHDKMMINNLICETLHPENIVAKIYNGNFQAVEKIKIYEKLNNLIRTNDVPEYNKLYASLK